MFPCMYPLLIPARTIDHADGAEERDRMLRLVRNRRFADGALCPHCHSPRIARNGWFSGRQRYRCNACRRGFSDLTGTPVAKCKRLDRWLDHAACMLQSTTIRTTARTIGVNPSTAFRWRHKTLNGLRIHNEDGVSGWLEFAEMRMPYSKKGQRKLTRSHLGHRERIDHTADKIPRKVTVVAVADRRGAMELRTVLSAAPGIRELTENFIGVAQTATAVLARTGRLGPYARFAKLLRVPYVQADSHRDPPLVHLDTAVEHLRNFYNWHLRFRGVATKYLDNYLAWYRLLDGVAEPQGIAQLTRWPLQRRDAQTRVHMRRHVPNASPSMPVPAHNSARLGWRQADRPLQPRWRRTQVQTPLQE